MKKLIKIQKKQIKIALGILAAVILSTIFLTSEKVEFKTTFNQITELDNKYNTSFKTERIGGEAESLINYKHIDAYLEELKLIREEVVNNLPSEKTKEEQATLLFIDTRAMMLLAQKNYHLGNQYGPKGFAGAEQGFSCSESGYLINTAYYYNLSYSAGLEAYRMLDTLIADYHLIANIEELVGMNKEKPRFFYSRLADVKTEVARNFVALEEFCFIDMSQGLISPVDPIKYNWIQTDKEAIKERLEEKGLNITYTTE